VLVLALPLCLAAVTVTILRWQMLVRTLGLSFSTRDALRAGFLGYLVNLAPFGLVGGDSLKAVMLIHKNPRRKTEAVASVLVDRVIGLYALLLLAAVASLFFPANQLSQLDAGDRMTIVNLCRVVQTIALISTAGLIALLLPGVTQSKLWDRLEHTPLVGPVLHKLVGAMRVYRQRLDVLLATIAISLTIHSLYAASVAVMATSIGIAPEHQPSLGWMLVIVPPSMIAGALPIGAYELTLNLLFRSVSPAGAPQNAGLLIALAYRIIQIAIASIGVGYWLTSRSEVREIIHEAEEAPPEAAGA
jgi:glycosyltransferase 2 family protein